MLWKGQSCAKAGPNGMLVRHGCGSGAWNASAYSSKQAPGDITLQFRCSSKQRTMVGLAIGNSNSNFSDIDCAMFCDKGTLRAYELGKHTWDGPHYNDSQVLGVRRAGSVVTFLQNGTLLRTCSRRLSGNVLADVSMHDAQGGVLEASWTGGGMSGTGASSCHIILNVCPYISFEFLLVLVECDAWN